MATGTPARDFAAAFDSCWVALSKGLGAPIGAVLAGSVDFIEEAWRWKHRLGGAMRQAGVIAAAGLYALHHNVARLAEDHEHARALAEGFSRCPGIVVDVSRVETNIVHIDITGLRMSSSLFVERLVAEHSVLLRPIGPTTVRAVTHLDVDQRGVDRTIAAVASLAGAVTGLST